MQTAYRNTPGRRLRLLAPAAAVLTTILGLVVMAEWTVSSLHVAVLSQRFIPMAPISAFCMALMGIIAFCRWWRPDAHWARLIWSALAAVVFVVSAVLLFQHLSEYLTGADLDVERLVVEKARTEQGLVTGRMSPLTASMFFLLALAALLSGWYRGTGRERYYYATQVVAAAVLFAALVLAVGYSYSAPLFYEDGSTPVSLTTTIGFILLGGAFLFEGPGALLWRLVTSDSITARFTRLVVPGTALIIIASRWLHSGPLASSEPVYFSITAILDAGLIIILTIFAASKVQKAVTSSEEQLKESEARFRALFNQSTDAIFIVDMNGKFIDINQTAHDRLGYTKEEMMAMSISELDPPEFAARVPERIERIRSEGHAIFESAHTKKDGSVMPVEINCRVFDYRGEKALLSMIRDITERKEAERELASRQELLELISRAQQQFIAGREDSGAFEGLLTDMLSLTESEYGFIGEVLRTPGGQPYLKTYAITDVAWNEATRDFYERNAPAGLEFFNLKTLFGAALTSGEPVIANDPAHDPRSGGTPEGHPPLDAFLGIPIISTGKIVAMVGMANRPGGYDQDLIDYLKPLLSTVGQLVEARRNEIERLQAEEALAGTAREWQTTFDAANDAIFVLDGEQRIMRANRAASRFFRLEPEEMIGKHCYEVVHGGSEPLSGCPFVKARRTLRREVLELQVGDTWLSINVDPILDEEGRFSGSVHAVSDITERKRAEAEKENLQQQLTQAVKMEAVGRLAGGVAHDFNNMLGAILGHAELALGGAAPGTPLHENLTQIIRVTERSSTLTRQLLGFARRQIVNPRIIDPNEVVTGTLKMVQRLIGENIRLEWRPGRDIRPVKVDPGQIDQILMNMAVNARDAIDGPGVLTIETQNTTLDESYCREHTGFDPGDYVSLMVSDDGCGMEKEILDNLFEPFFTTKDAGKGTGLGLAMVYGIVKQNKGFINVYSEPGRGTTFKIYIPVSPGESPGKQQDDEEAIAGGTETILLVEDDEAILEVGRRALEQAGYTVLDTSDPDRAIELAGEHEGAIRLVITDVIMPRMNGRDLFARIGELLPGVRAIFMSGYPADVIANQGVLEEDITFLQKPFSVNTLLARVREVLERD